MKQIKILLLAFLMLIGSRYQVLANRLNNVYLEEFTLEEDLKGVVKIWLNKQGKLLDEGSGRLSFNDYTVDFSRVADSLENLIDPYERYSFWGNSFSYKTVHYKQVLLKLLVEEFKKLSQIQDSVTLIRESYRNSMLTCSQQFGQLYSKRNYRKDRGKFLTRYEIESMLNTIPLEHFLLQVLSRTVINIEGDRVSLPYSTFFNYYKDWENFATGMMASRRYDYEMGTKLVIKDSYNRVVNLTELDTTALMGFVCNVHNYSATNAITQGVFNVLIGKLKAKAKNNMIPLHEAIYEMDIVLNYEYRKYTSIEFYYANKLYKRKDYHFPTGISIWLYLNSKL